MERNIRNLDEVRPLKCPRTFETPCKYGGARPLAIAS